MRRSTDCSTSCRQQNVKEISKKFNSLKRGGCGAPTCTYATRVCPRPRQIDPCFTSVSFARGIFEIQCLVWVHKKVCRLFQLQARARAISENNRFQLHSTAKKGGLQHSTVGEVCSFFSPRCTNLDLERGNCRDSRWKYASRRFIID